MAHKPTPAETTGALAISGENLTVAYKGRNVLDVERIALTAGETYVLLGASGAGKSTLLRVLGLLESPKTGVVKHDGKVISAGDIKARRRLAAVFQKPFLLRGTVEHNVGYGLKLRGVRGAARKGPVAEALERVGLAGWEKRSALTLSGGEAQRVALARALVLEPSLLLLDEPLSYLDPLLKRDLTHEFGQILASANVTALYVTHDQQEAAVVASRIGVMREGRLLEEGQSRDILTLPRDPWVASFIGVEAASEGTVLSVDEGIATIDCGGVRMRSNVPCTSGARIRVGVRPEDVRILSADVRVEGGARDNVLRARVAELTPSGTSSRVVAVAGGFRVAAFVSASFAKEHGLRPGSDVMLAINASDVNAS